MREAIWLTLASLIATVPAWAQQGSRRPAFFLHYANYATVPCSQSSGGNGAAGVGPTGLPCPATNPADFASFMTGNGIAAPIAGVQIVVPWSVVADSATDPTVLDWRDVDQRVQFWLDLNPKLRIGLAFSPADEVTGVNGLGMPSTPRWLLANPQTFPVVQCYHSNGAALPPAPVYFFGAYYRAWSGFVARTIHRYAHAAAFPHIRNIAFLRFGVGQGDETNFQAMQAADYYTVGGVDAGPCVAAWEAYDARARGQQLGSYRVHGAGHHATPTPADLFDDYLGYSEAFVATLAASRAKAGAKALPISVAFNNDIFDRYAAVPPAPPEHPYGDQMAVALEAAGFVGGAEGLGGSAAPPGSSPVAGTTPFSEYSTWLADIYTWSDPYLQANRPATLQFFAQTRGPSNFPDFSYLPYVAYDAWWFGLDWIELYEPELWMMYDDPGPSTVPNSRNCGLTFARAVQAAFSGTQPSQPPPPCVPGGP